MRYADRTQPASLAPFVPRPAQLRRVVLFNALRAQTVGVPYCSTAVDFVRYPFATRRTYALAETTDRHNAQGRLIVRPDGMPTMESSEQQTYIRLSQQHRTIDEGQERAA